MGVFTKKKSETTEDLARDYVTWESRRENLEPERTAAFASVLELQEAELEGRPDPEALQEARARVADFDEKLAVCGMKMKEYHEALTQAINGDYDERILALPQTEEALRREALAGLELAAKALAAIHFYLHNLFMVNDRVIEADWRRTAPGVELPDHLKALKGLALPVYHAELERLRAAEPAALTYLHRRQEARLLKGIEQNIHQRETNHLVFKAIQAAREG